MRAAFIVLPLEDSTDGPLGDSQCGLDGRKQSRVTEWFQQKPRCALLECSSTNRLIFLTGDEYDRHLFSATL